VDIDPIRLDETAIQPAADADGGDVEEVRLKTARLPGRWQIRPKRSRSAAVPPAVDEEQQQKNEQRSLREVIV
jgi:hypothetical protein